MMSRHEFHDPLIYNHLHYGHTMSVNNTLEAQVFMCFQNMFGFVYIH